MNDYSKEYDSMVPKPYSIPRWYGHPKYLIIEKYEKYLTGTVADFGCNCGVACTMLSMLEKTDKVIGFDIAKKALKLGEDVIRNHELTNPDKIELRYSNLMYLDCLDNNLDAAICFHTLEHIYPEDLDKVISEFHRVIKSGGYFIFSMPCRKAFSAEPTHVSFFSIEQEPEYIGLRQLLEKHGFEVMEIYEDSTLDNNNQLCITGVARA